MTVKQLREQLNTIPGDTVIVVCKTEHKHGDKFTEAMLETWPNATYNPKTDDYTNDGKGDTGILVVF